MEKDLIKIFQKAKYEPSSNIIENVWLTIVARDKRITRIKLFIFACIGFASLVGLIPAISTLLSDLTQSGVYEYFSLAFGNGWSILSYWKELIFSVAESLPLMSILFTLSLIFVFFLSLRYMLKQIDKNQLTGFALLSA